MTKRELRDYKFRLHRFYETKYKTMFKKVVELEGLDPYESDYIMERLFTGTPLAAFRLNVNEEVDNLIGFGVFSTNAFGMYQQPIAVQIVKENNSKYIPNKVLGINKDVAIIDTKYNPALLIKRHIERLVEIDITLDQNLKTHRMPFMIKSTDEKTMSAINDAIDGMTVVEVGTEIIEVMNTQTPYIIDNLHKYKTEIEHEILTMLGIDNVKEQMRGAQMNNDQVNANNDEINIFKSNIVHNLEQWFEEIEILFGVVIDIKRNTYLGDDDIYFEETDEKKEVLENEQA